MDESGAAAGRLPVVEQIPIRLGGAEEREIGRLAERLRATDHTLGSPRWLGDGARVGVGRGRSLYIHDMASIQAAGRWRPSALEYRALLLAADGDVVALWTPRVTAFEHYCRDVLRLGGVEVLRTTPAPTAPLAGASLATRARKDPALLDRLASLAASPGGLTVHPYIGDGAVWTLAAAVAERAGAEVRVAAPPPGLTRRANDKLWFARQVSKLLGERALPATAPAYGPAVLAARVRTLAAAYDRIAIKLPSAAGGEGNGGLAARRARDPPLREVRDELGRLLARRGWRSPFPVLVSAWESPVAATPSVQLWIPDPEAGPPIVEGVFEQRVTGPPGVFAGAAPARLPESCEERIAREAVVIGTLFQRLGYFGRCSFDAILVGADVERAQVHWVECNGRWGGTSIPMTLVNRLAGDWSDAPFAVVAPADERECGFAEAVHRMRERLFVPGAGSGVVFLSPGGGGAHAGISLLAIAGTVDEARRAAGEAAARLAVGAGRPARGG